MEECLRLFRSFWGPEGFMHRHYVGFFSMDGSTAYATGFAIDAGCTFSLNLLHNQKLIRLMNQLLNQ